MNLEQHQTGGLDLLGQMWTWVSGEAEVVVATPKYPATGTFARAGLTATLARAGLTSTINRAGLTGTLERGN